jgi:hypothetical protein
MPDRLLPSWAAWSSGGSELSIDIEGTLRVEVADPVRAELTGNETTRNVVA